MEKKLSLGFLLHKIILELGKINLINPINLKLDGFLSIILKDFFDKAHLRPYDARLC